MAVEGDAALSGKRESWRASVGYSASKWSFTISFDAPTVAGMAQTVSRERGQDVEEGFMSEDEHRRLLNEVGG